MIAGAGWDGPAEASFIAPALTCTVLTLTGFIGSDEPGTVPIGWVWITPAVSGAGSIFGSAFVRLGLRRRHRGGGLGERGRHFEAGGVRIAGGVQLSGDTAASCCTTGAGAGCGCGAASATSIGASAPLRSVIAAAVRVVAALDKVFGEQAAHDGIARAAAAAAHDDADQEAVAAMHRGHEIEAGSAGVAGLDAVDAVDAAEQVIVIGDGLAAEAEGRGREIAIVAREAVLDRAAERGLVARAS